MRIHTSARNRTRCWSAKTASLVPADSIDEAAAQCLFPQPVRDRVEPLLDAAAARKASAWNAARHPKVSGVSAATLLARLERYVNRSAIESAMQKTAGLKDSVRRRRRRARSGGASVPAEDLHGGQALSRRQDRRRHARCARLRAPSRRRAQCRGCAERPVPRQGPLEGVQRLQQVYRTDRAAFEQLGTDVSPKTWYRLFVNAPFLGRPFTKGIHVELMRRLRQAEKWLLGQSLYKQMSPVELGAAMNIDEDHHGGRTTANNSMHTLGLAADIRYIKNPWVAGQHNNEGKPNESRNTAFKTVTRNVSRLLGGTDEVADSRPGCTASPLTRRVRAYRRTTKSRSARRACRCISRCRTIPTP